MKALHLVRGEGYLDKASGLCFTRGEVRVVEEEVAARLLGLGRFAIAQDISSSNSQIDCIEFRSGGPEVRQPKNILGDDDLNGKTILLRRRGGIGDCVFVAFFAEEIKRRFPKAYITLGCEEMHLEFCGCLSVFDNVITLQDASSIGVYSTYDYVLSLNGILGSESGEDTSEYFRAHLDCAGMQYSDSPSVAPILSADGLLTNIDAQMQANEILNSHGLSDIDYVVLVLGSSNNLKLVTPQRFTEIAEAIANSCVGSDRVRVLALGSRHDRKIDTSHKWVFQTAGTQSLSASAEIIRRARCVVGCDTGLMHFAAAIGVPSVFLWGPTDPSIVASRYGKHVVHVVANAPDCVPCRRIRSSFCPHFNSGYARCMRSIEAKTVAHTTALLLQEHKSHAARFAISGSVRRKQRTGAGVLNVAVLLDYADRYTGGGFYTWSFAKAFATVPGVRVTVFTDVKQAKFVYTTDDVLPDSGSFSIVYDSKMNKFSPKEPFDLVVGNPPFTGQVATAYATRNRCKSAVLVYETPQYLARYRDGLDTKEEYWSDFKKSLVSASRVICISKAVKSSVLEWVPELAERCVSDPLAVSVIHPAINDAVADNVMSAGQTVKESLVVLIGRNVEYKSLHNAMKLIAENVAEDLGDNISLTIIGDEVKKLEKRIQPNWKRCSVTLLENVSEQEKWDILKRAKVLVNPSECEGFGITPAEGLYALCRVVARPLEVTEEAYSDMYSKFLDDEDLVTAVSCGIAAWNEEDEAEEAFKRRAFVTKRYKLHCMTKNIRRVFKTLLDAAVDKSASHEHASVESAASIRVALVSPWDIKCGIAETTRTFAENFSCQFRVFSNTDQLPEGEDRAYVTRCWDRRFKSYDSLIRNILEYGADVVHIEHEHSIFQNVDALFNFIRALKSRSIKVVVTLHTFLASRFVDDISSLADVIVVTKNHESEMKPNFVEIGLPIAAIERKSKTAARRAVGIEDDKFVVGTFGFWQVHKGFSGFLATYPDVVQRVNKGKVLYLVSGSHPPKSQVHQQARREFAGLIESGGIQLFDDYPSIDVVHDRLMACDALVYNYSIDNYSSASAALRTGIEAGVPAITTMCPMFCEFEDNKHVIKVPFGDHHKLVDAICRMEDARLRSRLVAECDKYLDTWLPEKVAIRHEELYLSLCKKNEENKVA